MSSSDSNTPSELWARHYAAATQRRRARGVHRRDPARDGADEQVRRDRRVKIYLAIGALFVAITLLAVLLPR